MSHYDTYTIFALTPDGEAVWGARVNGQHLVELIDECLTDERVTYVEVYDGSCDPRIEWGRPLSSGLPKCVEQTSHIAKHIAENACDGNGL